MIELNLIRNYQPDPALLKDRVILVTGAGQGLGRQAALTYAAHGATVILHGRRTPKLEALYDEIESRGLPQPAIFPLDLEKAGDAEFDGLANAIRDQLGRLDGILHNAAHLYNLSPLELQTGEQWMTTLKVNLVAPFALTKACLPLLKASPDGAVIMTSETHGHQPAAYWGSFAVSKGGIETLVKIWAQEWEIIPHLRINALVPGPVQSPQRTKTHPGQAKETLPPPESLVPAYLYLIGPDSKGISGQIVEWQ